MYKPLFNGPILSKIVPARAHPGRTEVNPASIPVRIRPTTYAPYVRRKVLLLVYNITVTYRITFIPVFDSLIMLTSVAVMTETLRRRVFVVGGTHGNEYAGVHVIKHLEAQRSTLGREYPSLDVQTLLANPAAHAANKRFIDDDLNRQFTQSRLTESNRSCYETNRAEFINNLMGPKGPSTSSDMCIDLHTTTANMGCTIIVNSYCDLAFRIAAFVQTQWKERHCDGQNSWKGIDNSGLTDHLPSLQVYVHETTQDEAPYLCSVSRAGITVEVGPTPQGLLRADVVATTQHALRLILKYLDLHYSGKAPAPPSKLSVYVDRGKIPWPDSDDPNALPGALVVPSLQDRDFEPLKVGDPMFVKLDGSVLVYDGSLGPVVNPIFINEAAYYYAQSGRGIAITQREDWPVN